MHIHLSKLFIGRARSLDPGPHYQGATRLLAHSHTRGTLRKRSVRLPYPKSDSNSNNVRRAALPGDWMPHRVANEARAVTPERADGAGPITADDYGTGMLLGFEGGFYQCHMHVLLISSHLLY